MKSNAGTVLFIAAGVPASNDVAGFAALNFLKLNGILSISEISERTETTSGALMTSAVIKPRKTGVISYGPVNVELFRYQDDTNQLLFLNSTASAYSYKILDPSGAITYFSAQTTEITDSPIVPKDLPTTTLRLELINRLVRA